MVTYDKQEWSDELDNFTPLSADRMNHMEDGIKAACDAWDSVSPIQSGITESKDIGGTSNGVVYTVTFPRAFDSMPVVTISAMSGRGANSPLFPIARIQFVTEAGFTAIVHGGSTGTIYGVALAWLAVG